MIRNRPTTIRAACLLMTAALAACGRVDGSDPLAAAVPGSINACKDCHMSVTMVRRADTAAAGYETMLRGAVQTNLGTMGQFGATLTDADYRDLAAYLASPGI